jgi:putative heme-binding domain-containing protein
MQRYSKISAGLFVVAAVAIITSCSRNSHVPTAQAPAPPAPAPYGIDARPAWTTSHVTGSPEAPPPYQTRRAYPNLTFKNPLDVAFAPGSHRVFVAEQRGRIYSFPDDENCDKADLFADIPGSVHGWENLPFCKGPTVVYGFTFHPHFQQTHYVYICYALEFGPPAGHPRLTPKDEEGTRISRFKVSDTEPPQIDPASEQIMLTWYAGGHNGGCLKFGADGDLYISSGDGGDPDPPDPFNTGQDISDLLCSILRIDVDHPSGDKPYSIPTDNPFINTPGARPEVYAYGLRNPWRMSFDRQTGNLWVGDVGWELWESVQCIKPGGNYGWSIMEGPNPVHPDGKRGPTPITPPMIALSHAESASLTGGVVYRGTKLPELMGHYIFGDWQTSRLWAAKCDNDKLEPHRTIAQTGQRIVAFGEQADGELVIVDHQGGGLWRIVLNDQVNNSKDFPRKLSETGLFVGPNLQSPAPGVIPFSINAPQWVDGASAERWVAIPGSENVKWGKGVWGDPKPAWPKDSVLVRTLSVPPPFGSSLSTSPIRIETQILHFDGKEWNGYSYAWNDEHTDADLVSTDGDQKLVDSAFPVAALTQSPAPPKQMWHFASRAQCMTCHNGWADYALAFNTGQLDHPQKFGDIVDNEVRTFKHIGLLLNTPSPSTKPVTPSTENLTLTDPYDTSRGVNERARSYLHVNCSHCHRFGGGGSALFDVRKELSLAKLNLIDAAPNLGNFGLTEARIVAPGDPSRSVLLYRMAKLGRGRMPHIGSDCVDSKGVELIRQWIAPMPKQDVPQLVTSLSPNEAEARNALLRAVKEPGTSPADASLALDQLLSSTSGALAITCEIQRGTLPPATISLAVSKGLASSQEFVHDLFRRFDPAEQQRNRLGTNINPTKLLSLHGDAARGRDVFGLNNAQGLCARCHRIGNQGTEFGPDLSHIATKYSRADLLDNILNPSKTIAPGFATYVVRTNNGDTFSGFLIKKTDQEIVLKDAQFKEVHIAETDVQRTAVQSVSAMPEGLLADLDPQQAADLLEFVASLK